LLEEKMGDFIEGRGEINTVWGIMEYIRAWGEAWLGKKVMFNESISRALFEAAWAIHEYNSFGSCDYWGTALGLAGSVKDVLTGDTVVVSPIDASDIDDMKLFVEKATDAIDEADSMLDDLAQELARAKEAHAENRPVENIREMLKAAAGKAGDIRAKISEVEEEFGGLVAHASQSSADDVAMASIHTALTTRSLSQDLPSPKEQVGWAVGGIRRKLSEIETSIEKVSDGDITSEELEGVLKSAESVLEGLRSQPAVYGWAVVKSYEDNPPREVENHVPIHITENSGNTLSALKHVLNGLAKNLDELLELPGVLQERLGEAGGDEISRVDVNEIPGLDDLLREKLTARVPGLGPDRENFYRVFPPPPVNLVPGISVFHELGIKEVVYAREDLAGLCNVPRATPIPLPFLNLVLWWGQWETTIELEGTVEEIFDFENPTILQSSPFGYVHQPLAYRWEIPEDSYKIRVVVISLKPFEIG
jgi:hypothetical protein